MINDLVTPLFDLPHRLLELASTARSYNLAHQVPFRLIQPVWFPNTTSTHGGREYFEGWEFTGKYYLTYSPNNIYATRLLDEGKQAIEKARAVLTESPSQAKVLEILGGLESDRSRAATSINAVSEAAKRVPEELSEISRCHPSMPYWVKSKWGTLELITEVDIPLRYRMITTENLGRSELRETLRLEEEAIRDLARFDGEASRMYGAALVARGEATIASQASKILHCLGAAVSVLACIYFAGNAFEQLSKNEDPVKVAQGLFRNVVLTFSGLGEGFLLQALWS